MDFGRLRFFLQRRVGGEGGDPEAWGFSYDVMEGRKCMRAWMVSLLFDCGWTGILQERYLGRLGQQKQKAQAE